MFSWLLSFFERPKISTTYCAHCGEWIQNIDSYCFSCGGVQPFPKDSNLLKTQERLNREHFPNHAFQKEHFANFCARCGEEL